jgi:hypothetical protein
MFQFSEMIRLLSGKRLAVHADVPFTCSLTFDGQYGHSLMFGAKVFDVRHVFIVDNGRPKALAALPQDTTAKLVAIWSTSSPRFSSAISLCFRQSRANIPLN